MTLDPTTTAYLVHRNGIVIATLDPGITTFDDISAIPGTEYFYYVTAVDASGTADSNTVDVTTTITPPPAPLTLTATAVSSSEIDLVWTINIVAPELVSGFYVYRGSTLIATIVGITLTYSDTGLGPGITYSYTVKAYNGGGPSPPSPTATATTFTVGSPPAAPIQLASGVITTTTIALAWVAGDATQTGFYLYRGGVKIATLGAATLSFIDVGLLPSTTYSYFVTAFNLTGESPHSNTITPTTLAAPSPPAAPTLTGGTVTPTTISLTWTAGDATQTGFYLYRDGVKIATFLPSVRSYTDTGLTPATTYNYYLTAFNVAGESAHSNTVTLATQPAPSPPGAPDTLTATAVSTSEIDLVWTQLDTLSVLGFKVFRHDGSLITTISNPAARTYANTGITPGTTVTYYVEAYNAAGDSLHSPEATATTFSSGTAPAAPTLSLGVVTTYTVSLSWVPGDSTQTGYNLYRGGVKIASPAGGATAYTDTGLAPSTSYSYYLTATNPSGESAHSNTINTTTLPAGSGPALLSVSDFTYQGIVKVSTGITGQFAHGLAYRPSTDTYFVIGQGASKPYHMYEISLPPPSLSLATASNAVLVKDWGTVDAAYPGGALPGPTTTTYMNGLYYDATTGRLWFVYGSTYNVADKNYPCIGYVTLDTGTLVGHGPWLIPHPPGGNSILGSWFPLPTYISSLLNMTWGGVGIRTSGGSGSWGIGLIAVGDPSSLPAATSDVATWPAATTTAAVVIDWPEITVGIVVGGKISAFSYSLFQKPSSATSSKLFGSIGLTYSGTETRAGQLNSYPCQGATSNTITLNAATIETGKPGSVIPGIYIGLGKTQTPSGYPPTGQYVLVTAVDDTDPLARVATVSPAWTSIPKPLDYYTPYNPNTVSTVIVSTANFQQEDRTAPVCWIELPDKHGYVENLSLSLDYCWYANSDGFCDPTPAGATYNADLDSNLYSGQKVINYRQAGAHGNMAEAWGARMSISDPNAILAIAQKIAAGTVVPGDYNLAPALFTDLTKLGGTVQTGSADGRGNAGEFKSDAQFINTTTRTLYLLANGVAPGPEPCIQVWSIS